MSIILNGRRFRRVLIDQHYRLKHAASMSDELILRILASLSDDDFSAEKARGEFTYLVGGSVFHQGKPYRLILVYSDRSDFLGVINAFRVKVLRLI